MSALSAKSPKLRVALLAMAMQLGWLGVVGPQPQAEAATLQTTAADAAAYITARGERAAVAVVDRNTGRYTAAGDAGGLFSSASLVKLFIAARLLSEGRMTGSVAATAYQMITRSDDDAATSLYGLVGGDSLGAWIQARYDIPVGRPADAGWWGETKISALGIVKFYQAIAAQPTVGLWLMGAMAAYNCTAADGWPQCFGIPAASTGVRIKQGWMCCLEGRTRMHSTGFAGHDRYAVAILTEGPTSIYGAYARDTVTGAARRLMPGGVVPDDSAHNPHGYLDSATSAGSTVTLAGWAADVDGYQVGLHVDVWEGSRGIGRFTADRPRPDVNAATKIPGNHGFTARFVAGEGTHTFCAYAINIGIGVANVRLGCRTIVVRGAPIGYLDSATPGAPTAAGAGRTVSLGGWAADADSYATPLRVHVYDGSVGVASVAANMARPDVTRALGIVGSHGFSAQIPASRGLHNYCAYAIDIGPASGNTLLGCRPVNVP